MITENELFEDLDKDESTDPTTTPTPTPEAPTPQDTKAEQVATAAEPKKETRGRKKKGATEPKKETHLDEILSEYKTAETKPEAPAPTATEAESLANIVNGYMLLIICDVVIAGGVLTLFKMFDKSLKSIEVNSIGLSNEQRKKLEPLADKVAISLLGNVSPIALFTLTLGAIYYTNILEQKEKVKK